MIYVTGYFFTAAPLVTQLRSAGIRAPIVGSQAFDAQKLLEIAGPAVEGVYIVGGLNRDRDMPSSRSISPSSRSAPAMRARMSAPLSIRRCG